MFHGKSRNSVVAMTLMELLIALILIGLIVLGIMNLEIFCKHAFTTTDRKTKVTNEATYIVEHMSKYIARAIGNGADFPVNDIPAISGFTCDRLIRVWTKTNTTAPEKAEGDQEVAYCFDETNHRLTFFPHIRTWPDTFTQDSSREIMSRNTIAMNATFDPSLNYVHLNVTTCWNASIECGSVDNPRIQMETRVFMPSVSAN